MADSTTDPIPEPDLPLVRLGSGRAAEVYRWSPGIALKLSREPQFDQGLQLEAAALRAAADAGVPVPRPRGMVTHEGRAGLLMNLIEGADILSTLEKKPWRVWSLGSLTGKVHAQLGEAVAPPGAQDVITGARSLIAGSERIPESAKPRVLALLDTVQGGDRLCHLDFHPGNVMLTASGPVIIDFPNSASGPALADHAKAWVVFSAGHPPPDTPFFGRVLIKVFRKLACAAYMRAYRAARQVDAAELARWKAIAVAVRLEEGIPEERETLLRLLSRTLREAEG